MCLLLEEPLISKPRGLKNKREWFFKRLILQNISFVFSERIEDRLKKNIKTGAPVIPSLSFLFLRAEVQKLWS